MNEMSRKELMMEVMAELQPEIEADHSRHLDTIPGRTGSGNPPLSQILLQYLPLPHETLFLGVAEDGLPVLLGLRDQLPGPLLIAGDAGCGKTDFLRMIAHAVDQMHHPKVVQYGVITPHPEEWKDVSGSPNCVEIFPAYKNDAQDFLNSLTSWAHANRGENQSVLLLIDDLSMVTNMDFEVRQNLRWLLLRGPSRRVWPIVTVNPEKVSDVLAWMELFKTRLFGRTEQLQDVQRIVGRSYAALQNLRPNSDFLIREGESWLKFWIPSLD